MLPKENRTPTREELKEMARRILERRGEPPYDSATFGGNEHNNHLAEEEAWLISDFVANWKPNLVTPPKEGGNG